MILKDKLKLEKLIFLTWLFNEKGCMELKNEVFFLISHETCIFYL